jgi:hypothetical protein
MPKFEKSPLKKLTDRMFLRISESDIKTSKLSEIIQMACDMREALLEVDGRPENDWWKNQAIKDFTEVIVRGNYKAQTILNPGIVMDDLEDQVKEALEDISKKL